MNDYINEYLLRIGLTDSILYKNKLKALGQLQRQHLFNIPFENIDFTRGNRREINQEFIHQKLITEKKGGMCTELNYSFYRLLCSLGYEAKIISGYVKKCYLDHMIIIVKLDREYLVDVGFGAYFFRTPVPLDGSPVNDINGSYRVYATGGNHFELQKVENHEWVRQYAFYNQDRKLEDFFEPWEWFYSEPNPFSLNTICRIDTPDGNINLYNDKLTLIKKNKELVWKVSNEEQERVLREHFGLNYFVNHP